MAGGVRWMKAEREWEGKPGAWVHMITKMRKEYRDAMYGLHHRDTKVDCGL